MITLTPSIARRLAITRQSLANARVTADANGILSLVRDLGCLQLDPINAVAKSHLLVLWSRLGNFDRAHLDTLMWRDKKLFEYWAHCASIVLTEDYPIHNLMMRTYPSTFVNGASVWRIRLIEWMKKNEPLRRQILRRLKREGPLFSRELENDEQHPNSWVSNGWTSGRNVSMMLDRLWMQGKITVVERAGNQKRWGLADEFFPEWTPRDRLSLDEVEYRAAQRSLRALGVATATQIRFHFIRWRYPNLKQVLSRLEREGRILPARIEGLAGEWFIHAEDVPLVERLGTGEFEPRTTLLSPFDNLIADRGRTRQLFDFDYTIEIYVPQAKRKYGYYVLPILHGDKLIGRIDPLVDRERGVLNINTVYAEPDAPKTRAAVRAIRASIEELAAFVGASDIAYPKRIPRGWERVKR
jgi:uncharacterized protein YcaQ